MAIPHHVFGEGDVLLHEADSYTAAKAWAAGYTHTGDWGGYAWLRIDAYGPEVNEPVEYLDNPNTED